MSINRLSYFVIAYMILAFGWWAYHLWERNENIYTLEQQLLEYRFYGHNQGVNLSKMRETAEYAQIEANWYKGKRMILAEGLFFTACLVFGLWVIRRSVDREVSLARQRRNFLLSITHELKSPIASMRLVFETMTRHSLNEEQRRPLLSNGLKDADRLQRLVEDLLLAARLEDKWQPVPEPVDVAAVLQSCRDALLTGFPNARIEIQHRAQRPFLQADKLGFTAVIKNLLENALKYAPEGTSVFISTEDANGKYKIQVADQGPGIPDEEKARVFEKFYRLGNEEVREKTGTGLGLFIVSQVVKAHRGAIQVSDNTPRGTIFTITF